MDRRRSHELRTLFRAALARPRHERVHFVDAACGTDASLREELLALLEAVPEPGTDGPPQALAPVANRSPRADIDVPGYVLHERIASGTSSVVYRALQLAPRREVAVKLLRAEASGEGALQRFLREAQILGELRHPGIAQVYGTGLTTGGAEPLPWIAMELVHGVDLDVHVQRTRPPARDVVALLREVCAAVAHAHERGVVHRDLKASNLMVDDSGRVRVLDFGVARLLARDALATAEKTRTGSMVGSLATMAPEQARGDNDKVDARADVYALGVLLFELLTGRSPLALEELDVIAAVRAICADEPRRLASLRPDLPRDLDAIVGKCLEKSPERRYRDAGELRAELADFLAERPVRARPPSLAYQFRKFVARHRTLSFSTAAIVLALSGGLAIALRGLRAERLQRERTSETLDFFAGKFLGMANQLGFGQEQRADLEAVEERIRRQLEFDLENRALGEALVETLYELASLDQVRGDFAEQRARVESASAVCDRLLDEDPDDLVLWSRRSQLEAKLGEALRDLGDDEGRDRHFARALEIDRRLAREHPENLEIVEDLGWSLARVASYTGMRGDRASEEALFRERLADAQRIHALEPGNWKFAFGLSHAHYCMAAMHMTRGEVPLALEQAALNVQFARRAVDLDPTRRALAAWLCDSLRVTAGFHAGAGDLETASKLAEEALTVGEFVVLGDPLRDEHIAIVERSAALFAELEVQRKRHDSALRAAAVLRRVAPVVQRVGASEGAEMMLRSAAHIEALGAGR